MDWGSVALTMEHKKILESKKEWLDDSLITGQRLRAQVWLTNNLHACVCVVQNADIPYNRNRIKHRPQIDAALQVLKYIVAAASFTGNTVT